MGLDPRRFFVNDRGSTLVLVMMGSAFFLVMGMGTMYLMTNALRSAETAIANQQMASLVMQVTTFLKDENSCRIALGGPVGPGCYSPPNRTSCAVADTGLAQPINPSIGVPSTIKVYRDTTGAVLFTSNPADNGTNDANRFGDLTITGITVTPESEVLPKPAGARVFFARLQISARKKSDANGVSTLVGFSHLYNGDTKISLRVRDTAPYNLFSCSTFSIQSGANVAALPVCLPGQGIASVGGVMTCVQVICGTGQVPLGGTDAGGNVLCGPV